MVGKVLLQYVLISFAILTVCLAVRTRSRAVYGEFCDNRGVRCDSNLSLTCKNSTCVCMKPENMIYDPARSACAVLASEKCIYTVLDQYRNWQEELICVANAHCDVTKGVCVCNRHHLELANGSCIPKKNFDAPCETTSDCRQDLSLVCLPAEDGEGKKCLCSPEISEYSPTLLQCVGLVGEVCVNDLCTANAICREPSRLYGGGITSMEVEDSSSEDYSEMLRDPNVGRCQCRTAFGVTPDKRCRMGYGGKCFSTDRDHHLSTCMDWLKCKEGTCVCKYPTHQVYDKVSESCRSFVGGPCTKNPDDDKMKNSTVGIGCIPGAVCIKGKDSSNYRCACPEGFIENMDRGCDLDYGQRCRTPLSPNYSTRQATLSPVTNAMRCDRIGKLYCIDGICQCEDDLHAYDPSTKMCVGLVGATCNLKQKEGACISGAQCKARRGYSWNGNGEGTSHSHSHSNSNNLNNGICSCLPHFRESDDRSCTLIKQENSDIEQGERARSFTLKSGGTLDLENAENGTVTREKKLNSTGNNVWATFDEDED